MAVNWGNPVEIEEFRKQARTKGANPDEISKYIEERTASFTPKLSLNESGFLNEAPSPVEPEVTAEPESPIMPESPKPIPAMTEPEISAPSSQSEILPGGQPLTQKFGNRSSVEKFSKGVNRGADFGVNPNTPVTLPPGEWEVAEAFGGAKPNTGYIGNGTNRGYGNSIVVKNRKTGETLRFSHLNKIGVRPGELLQGGKTIALSGNTGNSTGPHLDIEYMTGRGELRDILSSPYARFLWPILTNRPKTLSKKPKKQVLVTYKLLTS